MIYDIANINRAYLRCRKGKRGKSAGYEMSLLDRFYSTRESLLNHNWSPSAYVCFLCKKPKLREIYAADFSDRVVHHLLVPYLESIYESKFIYHSYSNRKKKRDTQSSVFSAKFYAESDKKWKNKGILSSARY